MKAKDYYDQAVAELKKFCADNTNFDVQVVEEIYPLEVHFVPSATQLSFFPDRAIVMNRGEIGFISVVCGIEPTVKISLKLAIENSLLKKMISKAETIGKLYLHRLREEMLEKTAAAQRKRRETMAAIKAARKGGAPCVSST